MDLSFLASQPSTGPHPVKRSLSLHPEAPSQDVAPYQPNTLSQLRPRYADGQPRQEQSTGIRDTLLEGQPSGQPRNATELAVSLVNLVFPYDVRNTQRSLAKMYDRVKAVEAKAANDSAARQRAEQAMGALEKEMRTLQALVAKARPDPSEHMGIEAFGNEVRQRHEKMVNMVSEFNSQRESLLADINRLVDQTKQIQDDIAAKNAPPDIKATSSKETEDVERDTVSTSTVPGQAVGVEASKQGDPSRVPTYDISTASESEDGVAMSPVKHANASNTSTTGTCPPAKQSGAQSKKGKVIGRKLNKASSSMTKQPSTKRNLRSIGRSEPQASQKTSPKTKAKLVPARKNDVQTREGHQPGPRSVEHRQTENNKVVKQKASDGRLRRLAFTRFAKFIDAKARAEEPTTIRAHKLIIWEFIDGIEDKEMSAFVQNMLLDTFPETIITSKGRGKPYRRIIIEGQLEWNQVLEAIKNMPIPPFFLDGS